MTKTQIGVQLINKPFFNPFQYPPAQNIMLFTNARNEKNIKEWAFHHLLIGFSKIIIFDHKSDPPIKPFHPRVKILRTEMEPPVKIPLMKYAKEIALSHRADWMIYLDADEFIILNQFNDVKEMLNQFHHAHSLCINWLMFGSNYHDKEPDGLILENYTKSMRTLDPHVKTFVRPNEIKTVSSPHFYHIRNLHKALNLNNHILHPRSNHSFNYQTCEYSVAPAYIAHYVHQSRETYMKRKINLPTDDTGTMRGIMENIHDLYNEVENHDPKKKYAEKVRDFLSVHSHNPLPGENIICIDKRY